VIGLAPAGLLNKEVLGMYHDENGVPIPLENPLPFGTVSRQNGRAAGI
jgi:hypothetical protein